MVVWVTRDRAAQLRVSKVRRGGERTATNRAATELAMQSSVAHWRVSSRWHRRLGELATCNLSEKGKRRLTALKRETTHHHR